MILLPKTLKECPCVDDGIVKIRSFEQLFHICLCYDSLNNSRTLEREKAIITIKMLQVGVFLDLGILFV
jgi:hypothetical protein